MPKCAATPIEMFRSGKIRIRVRWDDWDGEFHCRILRDRKKIGEEHVHAPTGSAQVELSTGAFAAAARTALNRAYGARYITERDLARTNTGELQFVRVTRRNKPPKHGRY